MKKKIIISLSIMTAVFIIGIVAGFALMSSGGIGLSTGYCLKSDNGTCFLISHKTPIRLSDMSEDNDMFESFDTGDNLLVIHTGINESYPASTGAYFCVKISHGSESDISEDVISSLKELGWLKEENSTDTEETYKFSAKYLRTGFINNGEENKDFPLIAVINTYEELLLYYENNKDIYALGDEYTQTVRDYDREFFHKNALLVTVLEEGSGSISHTVEKVTKSGNNEISLYINRIVPEVGTCDMAYHHILTAVSKEDMREKNIRLFIDGKDASKKWEKISLEKDYANLSLMLPEGWDYEEFTDTSDSYFGISIFNTNAPESTLTLEYTRLFGVCGTGLRTEEITINGYKSHKGIYDGNPTFDYIVFENTPGYYVIKNYADGEWWKEYGEEANAIFETIKIAEGIIFREEAIMIASKHDVGEYKRQVCEFDEKDGIWTITFIKNETEQTVKVDSTGNIIN